MQRSIRVSSEFVRARLPWVIAAGVLVLLLATVNSSISFRGFSTLSKASGWDWRPAYIAPLHYLIMFPLRWFPAQWQPLTANVMSVLFSSLSMALLARSIAILPHDRTREQRQHERSEHSFLSIRFAWVAPLAAVLICALQMTFWENAIVATGESLDLLLFAYIARCLLEFRIDQRESWLTRAALIFGLGMTNNFAMIGFLPAFIVAIVWIRGRSFFNPRFCLRMAGFGLLGLSLYLVLPLIGVLSGATDQSFWEVLKVNLGFQKNALTGFPRYIVFLLCLVSVFPIVFMGIKWPASFGDINAAGAALTNLMSHVIHAVFLLACIYVAFDPPFSARRLGHGSAFLPLSYLAALSIGYFIGYFLLVFDPTAEGPFGRRSQLRKAADYGVTGLVWITALAAPIGLFSRNVGPIRAGQGPEFGQFGKLAAGSLPPEGGIVLSDDNLRLFALHSALASAGTEKKYALVDTTSLTAPAYHSVLASRYGNLWPPNFAGRAASEQVETLNLMQLLYHLSQTRAVYYLHPSFGYYFENLYSVPRNLVYQLVPYGTNDLFAPAMTAEQAQQNDLFWQKLKTGELANLAAGVKGAKSKKRENGAAVMMGAIYARAINQFGVELQRRGDLAKAGQYFEYALQLNPDNVSALINSEYNGVLQAGGSESGPPSEAVKKKLPIYQGSWQMILGFNGPVDEPNSCYLVAQTYAKGRNFRQAAQQLDRVCTFNPNNIPAHTAQATVYVQAGRPEEALRKVREIRGKFTNLNQDDQLLLSECEAWAQVAKNNLADAEKILSTAQEKYPERPEPYKALAEIYLSRGDYSNAVAALGKLVGAQPKNSDALINFAALKMRMGRYQEAIPHLDRALQLQPENFYALLNHGIANFQLDNLDAARQDYETLERRLPKPMHIVHYALGEIAYKKKQNKTALQQYEKYLKLAPRGTPEMKLVQERIQKLKSGTI